MLIYADGTVQVNHGGTEMGQGLHTKMLRRRRCASSACRATRIRADAHQHRQGAEHLGHRAPAAAPTSTARRCRPPARRCASASRRSRRSMLGRRRSAEVRGLRRRLRVYLPQRARRVACAFAAVVAARLHASASASSATGFYRTPGIRLGSRGRAGAARSTTSRTAPRSARSRSTATPACTACCRVDILHDVGDSLNPGVDRGQIEGGFVQGMGWLTCEELRWDDDGRLLTHAPSTYKIPTIGDVPARLPRRTCSTERRPAPT